MKGMGAMKRFLSYGRKFVLASNILFGCLSLGMAIAGFVMRFGDQPINAGILQKIKDSGPGISTDNFRPITESLKQAFGIFLILTGILSAPLVVFGFYTFLREKRNFLLAYAIVVGFLVVIQVFVNFHFARNPETVRELMKPYLRERINEYAGPYASDRVSLGWNYLMREYNCCGVDSVADLSAVNNYYYYYYYYQLCGGYSYYSYGNQEGCASALFGAYYRNNTGVIWSMIVLGVLDQIFMVAFAITLLKKNKRKVEPARNSEKEVWTTAADAAAAEPPQPPPPYIPSSAQTQHILCPELVPSIATPSAAQPPAPPHPVLPLPALAQPFQPGAVMFVPTLLNYGGNTMQTTYIPMTHMANLQYGDTTSYTNSNKEKE